MSNWWSISTEEWETLHVAQSSVWWFAQLRRKYHSECRRSMFQGNWNLTFILEVNNWLNLILIDPLVVCVAEFGFLHSSCHHHAPLHVLLCKNSHSVVSQVIDICIYQVSQKNVYMLNYHLLNRFFFWDTLYKSSGVVVEVFSWKIKSHEVYSWEEEEDFYLVFMGCGFQLNYL